MSTERMTWSEAVRFMTDFNIKNNITTKGDYDAPHITIVAVIDQSTFTEPYTEEQRSYAFTNHNKAFIQGMISNSIFAECLDGTEYIKLSDYIPDWKVEYCYVLEGDDRIV